MHIQDHYMDLLIFACIFDQLRNDDVVLVDKTNFRFRATLPPPFFIYISAMKVFMKRSGSRLLGFVYMYIHVACTLTYGLHLV